MRARVRVPLRSLYVRVVARSPNIIVRLTEDYIQRKSWLSISAKGAGKEVTPQDLKILEKYLANAEESTFSSIQIHSINVGKTFFSEEIEAKIFEKDVEFLGNFSTLNFVPLFVEKMRGNLTLTSLREYGTSVPKIPSKVVKSLTRSRLKYLAIDFDLMKDDRMKVQFCKLAADHRTSVQIRSKFLSSLSVNCLSKLSEKCGFGIEICSVPPEEIKRDLAAKFFLIDHVYLGYVRLNLGDIIAPESKMITLKILYHENIKTLDYVRIGDHDFMNNVVFESEVDPRILEEML